MNEDALELTPQVLDHLENDSIYIDVTNVYRWTQEAPSFDMSDIPMTPPFEEMVLSWYVKEGRYYCKDFCTCLEGDEMFSYSTADGRVVQPPEQARWMEVHKLFVGPSLANTRIQIIAAVTHYLDENGGEVGASGLLYRKESLPPNAPVADYIRLGFMQTIYTSFVFMNCKNIELVDAPVTRQMKRMAQRQHKPITKKKLLVIEPFKTTIRQDGGAKETEIKRALHIARGHFRTYSEERPLFGKYSGTYWIPMHTRGSKQHGVVEKDYKIQI